MSSSKEEEESNTESELEIEEEPKLLVLQRHQQKVKPLKQAKSIAVPQILPA